MILGDPSQATGASAPGGRTTLDDLFRDAALRRPHAVALVDALDREKFTDGAPRQLSYAEADRMISAIAGRLRRLGLQTDEIIGIHLPNTMESVLAFLGVLRAGMIAAPLPLLWRRNDLVHALSRLGAKLLVTSSRVGPVDHADLARHAAADVFSIRHVCAFGSNLPDGVVPLDDLYAAENLDSTPAWERSGNPAAHLALITWDTTPDGLVPVARNHMEILAGGLAIMLEGRFEQDATFFSALPASSFAGSVLTILPWLLTGGTLHLHQAFDVDALAAQLKDGDCAAVILPGSVVSQLAEAGCFASANNTNTLIALWRSPDRMSATAAWRDRNVGLIDVVAFGETGFIPTRRGANGKPAPIAFGALTAPRGAPGAVLVAELKRTETGTIALRGPMVPRHAFPPGAACNGLPCFKPVDGLVDTGFTCHVDRETGTMVVTGPPAGIIGVGGYRFLLRELQDLVAAIDSGGQIAALPDPWSGQRLSGSATDAEAVRQALIQRGVNPLFAEAFGPH